MRVTRLSLKATDDLKATAQLLVYMPCWLQNQCHSHHPLPSSTAQQRPRGKHQAQPPHPHQRADAAAELVVGLACRAGAGVVDVGCALVHSALQRWQRPLGWVTLQGKVLLRSLTC